MSTYADMEDEAMPIVVLESENTNREYPVNVRIHSECMTGDLFGSQRCDCGEQLDYALQYISRYGGIVIYLRQEGRGIGLINKLKAYNKQDEGLDTLEANLALGFHADDRDYDDALEILKDLGVKKINLLTNNPDKLDAFEGTDIVVSKRIPLIIQPVNENLEYLKTKKEAFGHLL
jgi:GTP cyclohydrolase II